VSAAGERGEAGALDPAAAALGAGRPDRALGARAATGGAWLLAATLLAAFNMRMPIAAPGPVIDTIRLDTGMSSGVAGALITIPFVCMSAFAFAGPPLVRRTSAYAIVLLALSLVCGGTLARAVAPTPALLIAATVPIGIGIAVMGVTLPVVIKQHFARRSGATTGAYVSAMSLGILTISLTIVPLSEALGGWRAAFALSAVPAVLAIALWLAVHNAASAPARTRTEDPPDAPAGNMRPGRVEIRAGLAFGLQSMTFAGLVGWVAAIYVDAGWSPGTAALTTASLGIFVIPGALILPSLSQGRDRRPWIVVGLAVMVAGLLGIALAPDAAAWVWLVAFGAGGGSAFALQLALPIDLRATPLGVARLTAWMLGLGYVLSACAPILVGTLRDLTGEFTIPVLALAALGSLGAIATLGLPRPLSGAHAQEVPPPPVA